MKLAAVWHLGNFKELNIIIKGDVDGSVEALSDSLQKLSTRRNCCAVLFIKPLVRLQKVMYCLQRHPMQLLLASMCVPSSQANRLAENEGVQIKTYSIIYNAIEEIKSAMEGMLEPKIQEKEVANVEIRKYSNSIKQLLPVVMLLMAKLNVTVKSVCSVMVLLCIRGRKVRIAELGSLKRFKDDVKEVASGMNAG